MGTIITLLIDIGLGLLAYRLAFENRKQIAILKEDVTKHSKALRKAGLLDNDDA